MTEEHIFVVVITAISTSGTLAASLLVPLIVSRIEKNKHKKVIKSELSETLYRFFYYRKGYIKLLNVNNYRVRKINIVWPETTKSAMPASYTQKMIRQHNELVNARDKDYPLMIQFEQTIIDFGSKIHRILLDVELYYGTSYYNKVYKIIKPILDESNKDSSLFDYRAMNHEEIERRTDEIFYAIEKKINELTHIQETVNVQIRAIFQLHIPLDNTSTRNKS